MGKRKKYGSAGQVDTKVVHHGELSFTMLHLFLFSLVKKRVRTGEEKNES